MDPSPRSLSSSPPSSIPAIDYLGFYDSSTENKSFAKKARELLTIQLNENRHNGIFHNESVPEISQISKNSSGVYKNNPSEQSSDSNTPSKDQQNDIISGHRQIQLLNLELATTHGKTQWEQHVQYLETIAKSLEQQLEKLVEKKSTIQKQRFDSHNPESPGGIRLAQLEKQYLEILTKNVELSSQISILDNQGELLPK